MLAKLVSPDRTRDVRERVSRASQALVDQGQGPTHGAGSRRRSRAMSHGGSYGVAVGADASRPAPLRLGSGKGYRNDRGSRPLRRSRLRDPGIRCRALTVGRY
ncbi:hypothetical protein GCM10011322_04610 [Salinarimonas ramus]|uniref:Uncharacterized protein n=1 Tax=Salinarimonas ramus TaxID=690164 RepID=A0A917Q4L0_9HYPH|nr:hypothetical protein GCM10011322_04610 [Salinarimonas ramus]